MTKCKTCNKDYTPECDYNQGRCPHHPPLINIQPKDVSKGHFYVSMVKSAIRIAAGGALVMVSVQPELIGAWLKVAGGLIILAECLGILEELV